MKNDQSVGLSAMSIESDILNDIDFVDINRQAKLISDFVIAKSRKVSAVDET